MSIGCRGRWTLRRGGWARSRELALGDVFSFCSVELGEAFFLERACYIRMASIEARKFYQQGLAGRNLRIGFFKQS